MKYNRLQQIQELLKTQNSISLDDLCLRFDVSKNTIRRDVAELDKLGIIRKVYGGIVLQNPNDNPPEPFVLRENRNLQAKQQIAQIAAAMVNDGDVIFIDSGTTTMHMIPHLVKKQHLTIVTASLHVINAAANYTNLNIIATGGAFYIPSKAFVGPSVLDCLQRYNISKAFLASTGISLEHGATNASPLEYEIKQCLVKKNCTKYLLVDTSKLDVASLMTYCQLKDLDYIIINGVPPKKYVEYFGDNGVKLITPETK